MVRLESRAGDAVPQGRFCKFPKQIIRGKRITGNFRCKAPKANIPREGGGQLLRRQSKDATSFDPRPREGGDANLLSPEPLCQNKRFCFKTNRSSGNQNRGAFEAVRAEIGKGLVGMLERIAGGLGDNTDLGHEAQEINAVLPREIGDRHELPLFP
jgi:hypothetical protein